MKQISKTIEKSSIRSLLSKPTWTVHDLVKHNEPLKTPPREDQLFKLSKLAGLDPPSLKMLQAFTNQLKFVELLRNIDTTDVEPVTRLIDVVDVPENLNEIHNSELEEGEWNPVNVASEKESDYYVVKDGLHGNDH